MRTKLVYEDFKKNLPSEKIMTRHRTEQHERNMVKFNGLVEKIKQQRLQQEPFQKALLEFYNREKIFNHLKSPSSDPGRTRKTSQRKGPEIPRLKQRIFQHGSLHVVDLPVPEAPFVGWVDNSPAATPDNDAAGGGQFNGFDSVDMNISAGEGLNGDPQSGGNAACWGYIGEYFTPAAWCVDWLEAVLMVSASPSGYCDPYWTTTYVPFGPTDYAKLTITVNLVCFVYDKNWNYLNSIESVGYNIINPVDQFTGSDNYGLAGFDFGPVPLTLTLPVSTDNNYGFFVQYFMFASGNGESTGSWVPGSNADATLVGSAHSLQFDALWNY